MKSTLFVLFVFLFAGQVKAQPSNFGSWYIYFGNLNLPKNFNWHNEVQYRNYNIGGDLEQLMLRTGIGYNLTENNNNILLGYGFILSENYQGASDIKTSSSEHRIFQQYITKQSFGRVSLQHRYRLEERFIDNEVSLRGRYFLSFNVALNHKTMTDKTFYISAYDEVFLVPYKTTFFTTTNVGVYFDRNRAYAGLGYKLNDKLRFELGYMNQFFSKLYQRDQLNIICFFNF